MLDMVLPRVCAVCARGLMPQERHICLGCLADLPETRFHTVSRNPMADKLNKKLDCKDYEPYAYAAALYHYSSDSDYSRICRSLKYGRDLGAGRYFSRLFGKRLASSPFFKDVDLVVPVPLHWTRLWARGYNQAEVIARQLAGSLGAGCETGLLKRVRRTRTQTRLGTGARASNVAGAFAVRDREAGRILSRPVGHVLIVDDVFTSGATVAECYAPLRHIFGPKVRISVATLGYAGE